MLPSAHRNTTFPHPATVAGFIVAAVASSIRLIAAALAWPDVGDGAALPSCCDLGMLMANQW
jgi:hypothetical protein